jgi:hypoxanthine-guanine phosphoribosyltransferase
MHKFYLNDLQERDNNGNVTWSCFKCGKVFVAECGLDILKNGRCVGYKNTNGNKI